MGADTFEAREGWVPANTEGSVWCYRARGNAGILAFRRTEDGQSLYEATHQDCYASDETITTTRRVDAVRFAVTGAAASAQTSDAAAAPEGGSTEAPGRAEEPPAAPDASALGERAPRSPRSALAANPGALRSAWDRYIDATNNLLEHLEANLDDPAPADLLGDIDQALALVRAGTTKPQEPARPHDQADPDEQARAHADAHDIADPHDTLSTTLGVVLRKARALTWAGQRGS